MTATEFKLVRPFGDSTPSGLDKVLWPLGNFLHSIGQDHIDSAEVKMHQEEVEDKARSSSFNRMLVLFSNTLSILIVAVLVLGLAGLVVEFVSLIVNDLWFRIDDARLAAVTRITILVYILVGLIQYPAGALALKVKQRQRWIERPVVPKEDTRLIHESCRPVVEKLRNASPKYEIVLERLGRECFLLAKTSVQEIYYLGYWLA